VVPGGPLTTDTVRAGATGAGPGGGAVGDSARQETAAGVVLLGLSIVGAGVIHLYPGMNALDRRGFALVGRSPGSAELLRITDLGTPAALVLVTLVAAVIAVRHDRWRAAACVVGPLLTAVLVEFVLKPTVGRHYLGVLSYPSGNVADVAAVVTALALAVPRPARPVVVVAGAVAVGMMTVAVVGLRWHYPTDALAGAVLGVGTVLTVDGAVHLRPSRPAPHPQR
jgi:undecaprenyl-diphosphatase